MNGLSFDNEDIQWNCDICEDPLDRNNNVTKVVTSNGEVIKAEDGHVIDMEPQFPVETEHLCYPCYQAKYKEPIKTLRTVVGVVANVVELLEADANDDFYNPKAALEKLNELVVHIAGVLPSLSQKEGAISG